MIKSNEFDRVLALGEIAYMSDGVLYRGREATAVMVESEDDLTALAGLVHPGSIAFTAGFAAAWQLAADGTWTEWLIGGGDET